LQGLLTELLFHGKDYAAGRFQGLKNRGFQDSKTGFWHNYNHANADYCLPEQFLSILFELEIDPPEAKMHYERLKAGPFYDQENNDWYFGLSLDLQPKGHETRNSSKFMDLLIQLKLNKK